MRNYPRSLSAEFDDTIVYTLFRTEPERGGMYRVIVPEGEIVSESYEMIDDGVELYDSDEQFIGFVPFSNLREIMNEDVYSPKGEDRSIY